MTLPEKRDLLARAWLEKAEGDLETARAVLANPRIPTWVGGFHLQQAVEKAWKGRLVLEGIRPPAVHDLRALLEALVQSAEPPAGLSSLIEALQPFAVEERYPLLTPREAERSDLEPFLTPAADEIEALRAALAAGC